MTCSRCLFVGPPLGWRVAMIAVDGRVLQKLCQLSERVVDDGAGLKSLAEVVLSGSSSDSSRWGYPV